MSLFSFCWWYFSVGAVIVGSVDGQRIWGKDLKGVNLSNVSVSHPSVLEKVTGNLFETDVPSKNIWSLLNVSFVFKIEVLKNQK